MGQHKEADLRVKTLKAKRSKVEDEDGYGNPSPNSFHEVRKDQKTLVVSG